MFDSGPWPIPTPDVPHDNSVTGVDEVTDHFQGVGIPGFAGLVPLAHDRLPTNERSGLWPILGGPHDDVGVVQLTKCVHVPRVPRLEERSENLHVLLRHRPRSISRAGLNTNCVALPDCG